MQKVIIIKKDFTCSDGRYLGGGVAYLDGTLYYTHTVGKGVHREAREYVFACLHDGQEIYYRRTNNYTEHMLGDIRSFNHRDRYVEQGMSVSQHPFYPGYKYTGVVTGDVIGHGADGEPLLRNVRWLHRPVPTSKLPAKYQYKNIVKDCPITYEQVDRAKIIQITRDEFATLHDQPQHHKEEALKKKLIEIDGKRFLTVEEVKRWEAAEEAHRIAEYEKWQKSLTSEKPAFCSGCLSEVDEVGGDGLCNECRNSFSERRKRQWRKRVKNTTR